MHYMCYAFPTFGVICVLIRKYQEYKWGRCTNRVSLNDKVVLITGANSGIGYETAKELSKRGAKVILACRDLNKTTAAIAEIQKSLQSCSNLVPMQLDLASLRSVKSFVDELNRTETKIDILINNAGVSYPKTNKLQTSDGFEIHFGVNHLGHFLLTELLLPLLMAAVSARVIVVSSLLHQKANIYLDDLNDVTEQTKTPAYNNSKLANAYFSRELAERTQADDVHVYTVCPGWVYTGLFRNHGVKWYQYLLVAPIAFLFMRTPKQGAQTIIYCATDTDLSSESGNFYRNCAPYKSTVQFDASVANELWQASEKMIESAGIKLAVK